MTFSKRSNASSSNATSRIKGSNPVTGATQRADSPETDTCSVEVRLPASTSNLGAGFDCFGLALQLYLTIRGTVAPQSQVKCRVRVSGGEENSTLSRTGDNLIYRAMAYTAGREGLTLPPVHLAVQNEIPISRGLGGSAAAIVGGIKLCELLCNRELTEAKVLQYAAEFEGHPDNIAATLLGGFVVTCTGRKGEVIAIKRAWPPELRIVIVSPDPRVETKLARAALPRVIDRSDAVYNLQRTALFNAALGEHRYDLLWEAMQDRLHQRRRQSLVPGLGQALALPQRPGLLGLGLSGAGPSVLAIVNKNSEDIAEAIVNCFRGQGIKSTVRQLEIDNEGCHTLQRKQRSARAKI
jgi:homoserine kinase